ncbi:MAG: monovalent cation/H+ antiporter subunit D family protein [Actinomycetota bacterium]|nr:monovalent cation/H+ antiporter subunit D family protein [Actinomycetota bacterium]
MTDWLVAPVVLPLLTSALAALGRRRRRLQQSLALVTAAAVAVMGVALVLATASGRVLASALGGWPPRFAIVLAADPLAALLVSLTGMLSLAVLVSAIAGGEDHHPFFHPLVLVLLGGVCGSFLTADLFDLFVFFEVTLSASYVLITLDGSRSQLRAAPVYIGMNLLGSLLFAAGVALVYGATGTVNLAVLSSRPETATFAALPAGVILAAFAVKAAVAPVGGWLPITYPVVHRSVGALFAGLLTTVGVAAAYRFYLVAYRGDPSFRPALLAVAAATMLVGVLGAAGRQDVREALSFQVVAQVGFMVLGLGLLGVVGIAAGVFFIVQDLVVKTAAFLCAGTARDRIPTHGAEAGDEDASELAHLRPLLAAAFLGVALSLSGLPPLSGFFGKALLVHAAFGDGLHLVAVAALAASLVALVSMLRVWRSVCWAAVEDRESLVPEESRWRLGMRTTSPAALVALSLVVGLYPAWLQTVAVRAAEVLVDRSAYVEAVLR